MANVCPAWNTALQRAWMQNFLSSFLIVERRRIYEKMRVQVKARHTEHTEVSVWMQDFYSKGKTWNVVNKSSANAPEVCKHVHIRVFPFS